MSTGAEPNLDRAVESFKTLSGLDETNNTQAMIMEVRKPGGPLGQYVENFLYYRGYQPEHSLDRFLPDGHVNIVVDLTDYPKYIYDNDTLKEIQACRNVWFSGIRNRYITIPSGRDSEMFIINFYRGKAYPFVAMPMNELTDCVVDGDLVLTGEVLNLRHGLMAARSVDGMFRFAERYLTRAFARKLSPNPFVDYAVQQLTASPSGMTMEGLARKVGYSQKQLIKIFKEHVGVTPKSFLRIMRFQKAVQDLEARKRVDWASVAVDAGFYDQAHFIHDFKEFAGFTPEQYFRSKGEFTNYIPVG